MNNYILVLPQELISQILTYLNPTDLNKCTNIYYLNRKMYNQVWKYMIILKFDHLKDIEITELNNKYNYDDIYYTLYKYYKFINMLDRNALSHKYSLENFFNISFLRSIYNNKTIYLRTNISKKYDDVTYRHIYCKESTNVIRDKFIDIVFHLAFHKSFPEYYLSLKRDYVNYNKIRWDTLYPNIISYLCEVYDDNINNISDTLSYLLISIKNNQDNWTRYPELIFLSNVI